MLIDDGRVSSHDLSTIQQPIWTASLRRSGAGGFDEVPDGDCAVKDFLLLTDAARAALSAGRTGAVALVRARAISRASDVVSGPVYSDEHTALRHRAILSELSDFLASRLEPVSCPAQPEQDLKAAAIYGTFTLLVWQPDCTDAELSVRLQLWREEYRFLKHSDYVAGIASAPAVATDLLTLISLADEALTEAHSARRIVCFSPAPARTICSHSSRRPTLLIVDDNRDQVEILDLIMQQHSYHTLRAYNGEQALDAVRRDNPDLLLLDIGLPELDGFHVLSRLRDLNGGRLDLPVIMITGSDAEESVRRGFELGARDYVIKPCDPHDLLSRIQNILSTSSR